MIVPVEREVREPVAWSPPLAGRHAIVTGSSRGIGRAIALRLAADGARVVVNYRADRAAAGEVVERIVAAGGEATAVGADLGMPADIDRLFAAAAEAFGPLDILVNNAGVVLYGATCDVTDAEIDRVLAVNVRGSFLAMRHAARCLRDGGRVVNISTGYTRNPNPLVGVYTGSKTAVEQIGMSMAKELGHRGITVNAVLPGLVETDGVTAHDRQRFEQVAAMTPAGRNGRPDDIADVVAFLASDAARWVTGQTIAATGGLSF
ncbi:glucose 1-dehydrogenase [Frankia sp. AiPs1]|nr:glucose 1-dehydrogenase [Frankia sp. AiPs1]